MTFAARAVRFLAQLVIGTLTIASIGAFLLLLWAADWLFSTEGDEAC